jgi:hypothetical protein
MRINALHDPSERAVAAVFDSGKEVSAGLFQVVAKENIAKRRRQTLYSAQPRRSLKKRFGINYARGLILLQQGRA